MRSVLFSVLPRDVVLHIASYNAFIDANSSSDVALNTVHRHTNNIYTTDEMHFMPMPRLLVQSLLNIISDEIVYDDASRWNVWSYDIVKSLRGDASGSHYTRMDSDELLALRHFNIPETVQIHDEEHKITDDMRLLVKRMRLRDTPMNIKSEETYLVTNDRPRTVENIIILDTAPSIALDYDDSSRLYAISDSYVISAPDLLSEMKSHGYTTYAGVMIMLGFMIV